MERSIIDLSGEKYLRSLRGGSSTRVINYIFKDGSTVAYVTLKSDRASNENYYLTVERY